MDFLYQVSEEKRFISDDKLHPFEFRGRLAETVAWVVPHLAMGNDPVSDLRPESMLPVESGNLVFTDLKADAQLEAIKSLMRKRSRMIEIEQITVIMPNRNISGGKLLLYLPHFAEKNDVANGFFATDGTPPWATWVYGAVGQVVTPEEAYDNHIYIVAWIPPTLIETVSGAVDQFSALRWVDHFEPGF